MRYYVIEFDSYDLAIGWVPVRDDGLEDGTVENLASGSSLDSTMMVSTLRSMALLGFIVEGVNESVISNWP